MTQKLALHNILFQKLDHDVPAGAAGMETFLMLVFPALLVLGLLVVPFVSNRGERLSRQQPDGPHDRRRREQVAPARR